MSELPLNRPIRIYIEFKDPGYYPGTLEEHFNQMREDQAQFFEYVNWVTLTNTPVVGGPDNTRPSKEGNPFYLVFEPTPEKIGTLVKLALDYGMLPMVTGGYM